MDRTSWIVVTLCSLGLVAYFLWFAPKPPERPPASAPPAEEVTGAEPGTEPGIEREGQPGAAPAVGAKTVELNNGVVSLVLTNAGAGIETARLLRYPKVLKGEEPMVLNDSMSRPVGGLSDAPGKVERTLYEITQQSEREVVFSGTTPEGLKVEKRYTLSDGKSSDPYLTRLEMTVRNEAATTMSDRLYLYSGSAVPLHTREIAYQVGVFWKGTEDMEFENVGHFKGGWFSKKRELDTFTTSNLHWGGVMDQFFSTIVTAEDQTGTSVWSRGFPYTIKGEEEESRKRKLYGVEAAISLPELQLQPQDQRTLNYEIYMGPKEYARLRDLGEERMDVMNYDDIPVFGWMFGWAIRPLARFLIWGLVHLKSFVGNYGIAIILMTIIIRTIIWPLYAKSARSMKRMSKLTPLMNEIKAKYPDDQQKQQQEIMKLYSEYHINPLGGCLPMFIQLPIFLGYYRMLQSAVELRHEGFLWVKDLSMPDTLFTIPGLNLPFNLLPILMGVSMLVQMAMTPKTGDKTQRMIFMMMPVFFLFICYNFASALALYWTTSNIFSIGQTWLTNRMPEPELKKRTGPKKKGLMARLQDQAETQKKRTQLSGDQGPRQTQPRKKRKKR